MSKLHIVDSVVVYFIHQIAELSTTQHAICLNKADCSLVHCMVFKPNGFFYPFFPFGSHSRIAILSGSLL